MDTNTMLPVGTLLQGGKYRIDRYLSSGGFGNTYVATNLEFEEQVAIKEFFMRGINERDDNSVSVSVSNRSNSDQFSGQREKFKKEARRLRRLKEKHIVAVHDLFEENGTAYYVMDFINGESVSARLKRTGQPMGEAEALDILRQVLDALAVTHSHGIYHLDIKPGNIMLDERGRALLIDFGASKQSKQEGGATTSTGLCYTPGYAPIEQMEQSLEKFGPWTDFYALGATLYYMLTLHQLPSPADLLENEETALPMSGISQQTQQLIRRMMCPMRNKRPQNVEEVRALMVTSNSQQPTANTIVPVGFTDGSQHSTPNSEETVAMSPPPLQPKAKVVMPTAPHSVRTNTQKVSQPKKSSGIIIGVVTFIAVIVLVGVIGITAFFLLNKQQTGVGQTDTPVEPLEFTVNGVPFKMIPINDSVYIGETEVTQELWEAVLGGNPSSFKGPKRPVESVSMIDCLNFIANLNNRLLNNETQQQMQGRDGFDLPQRDEWMAAARGTDGRGYTYSGSNNIDKVAWYSGNSGKQTHDVAMKLPNSLGFYDMSGNVWEWCYDGPIIDVSYYMGGSGGSEASNCTIGSTKSAGRAEHFADLGFRLALYKKKQQ